MTANANQEIEAKFNVRDLNAIEQRLKQVGARLSQPRILEINYRFDTPDRKLSLESKVLRLRQDSKQWMTFKSLGTSLDGIRIRQEIEFSISDINSAQAILEALGYQIFMSYEKYRTVYFIDDSKIMLDELPFGNFIEIEDVDINFIKKCAKILNLQWELKIDIGYLEIYNNLCKSMGVIYKALSFENSIVANDALETINIHPAGQ